ncbi:sensor histidine kinase [Pseudorhodoferax sp.]|uniref:sensor histidine kinase n=1 Tax=Pseudorhodoferax sp. TaxID=1993553 RepID=UPI002DD67992|nr:ATP-binding protein [Pseudorhodoferax sp.]
MGARLAAWCLLLVLWPAAAPAAPVQTLGEARFVLRDDATPPPDSAAWVPAPLPDNWSATRREAQGIGWYRLAFTRPSGAQDGVGILVRRLSMNGELFVNGVRVLSGGQMHEPVTRNWNHPFFVEVPAALLHAGPNRLDVRIHAPRNANGGLGTVQVGDAQALRARHAFLYALHVKGALVSFAVALVAAFIGIVCWWRMGREALYGLFGLAMLAWAVRYANYFVQDVPLPALAYDVVVYSAQGWFFIFFTPFLLRLTQLHWPRIERALLLMGVLGTVGICAAFLGWVPLAWVIAIWMAIWLPGSAMLLLVSTRHALRARSVPATLAALVAWLYVPLTVRELLITSNVVPFDASYTAHYVGIPLVLLITWMLVDRVVAAAGAAAQAELARERAAADERRRITQDMHDGLGLQLSAALRMAERGSVDASTFASQLRACADELRLIVDASDAGTGEFLPLLANLRYRLQPKLAAIGIQLHWRMDSFPDDLVLPPGAALQILRVVQEAINNAVKHAGARNIHVEAAAATRPGPPDLLVRDDGTGFAPDTATVGRGLAGMRQRAATAGGRLQLHSASAGTTVRIELPDTAHAPP